MTRLFSARHWQKKIYEYGKDPFSLFLITCVFLSALITFASLIFILWHILSNGLMHITPSLFAWNTTQQMNL